MTAQEMLIGVKVGLRQLNTNQTRSYFDQEILLALNNAQSRFIVSKLRKVDNPNELLRWDIADEEALEPLTVDSLLPVTNNSISLPNDRDYFIRGKVIKECGDANITILKRSMVNLIQQTPFYKSSSTNYNAELINKKLIFFPHKNDVVITGVQIVYIRKCRKIGLALNQDSELDERYHQAIVDLTIGLMKVDNSQQDVNVKLTDNKVNQTILG